MSKQFFTFRKEFLGVQNYEAAKKNSLSLNHKYEQLCNIFQRQFAILNSSRTKVLKQTNTQLSIFKRKKYLFKVQLEDFISQFLGILEQQSQYQIQCLKSLKENNSCEFSIFFRLLQKVKENKVFCHEIELKTNSLFQKYSQTKTSFNTTKKILENPLAFYKNNVVLELSRSLRDKIAQNYKLMEEVLNKKTKAQQKIEDFQPSLSNFRKKLIKNKYQVLERISKLINNIKNAYLLLADTIKNCAITKKQQFERILLDQTDDIDYLKDFWKQTHDPNYLQHYSEENKQWEKLITQSITELDYELTILQEVFAQLILHFNNINNRFVEQQLNLKGLLMEISEIYSENQCPTLLVKELLSFQDIFNKKISKILVRFQDIQSKLRIQRSNFKKNGEMFLTLIKVNKYNGKSLSESTKRVQNEEIVNLINQLTFANIKKTILLFYKDSIFLPSQLLNKFDSFYPKRRETYDSMEVSHSELLFRCPVEKYTPLKEERWLWKQWKNEIQINFQSYSNYFANIQAYLQKAISSLNTKDSPLLEKENCVLLDQKEQIPGQLFLKVNSLQFLAQKLHLNIKLTQILGVSIVNGMFKDLLIVQTEKGKLQFFKLEHIDGFSNSIKEAQQKLLMGDKKKIDKKPLLKLSAQQLQVIKERKEKIRAELPNLDKYKLILQTVINPERIDQIYELFYSDKPFNFYGREEPCFFSYTGKKAGNYDWVAEGYDKPGPQFYTGNKQVSFKNCSTFSHRKITYNHPMKPSSIPFMPKFCSNIDNRKMFWISNEQLLYEIESQTKGVPYADHFLVYLIHKISKTEAGVKIQILYNIKWIKDTIMKSQIEGNVIPQLTQNMNSFVGQVKKVLRLRGQIERGEANLPEKEPEQQKVIIKPEPEDVSKIKLVNKIFMVAFAIILLFNVLNLFIFDGSQDQINR